MNREENIMGRHAITFLIGTCFCTVIPAVAQWPSPKAPAIPEADGYVAIPNVAVPPEKDHIYRVVFDASVFASEPTRLLPALNNAGAELNALSVSGVPHKNAKFAIVFRGSAIGGLLDDAHYRAKYGVSNPNLNVLAELKKAGVELFVCGQYLAFEKIDPKTISPEVVLASDALIVLIKYQNSGYALLCF
jgi:intracellular sulfur oxidation DsrE/DsrF family protein